MRKLNWQEYSLRTFRSVELTQAVEAVAVVVLDGEELLISICLTQHRLAHQLGSSLLLQEDPVLDSLVLPVGPVIQLCSPLKAFNTPRSVEESLDISLETGMF